LTPLIRFQAGMAPGANTNCQAVFKMLGADNVHVADIYGHEGADIIMDLNLPCDKKYYNRFDTIFDVGTLEHVFNMPQALVDYLFFVTRRWRSKIIDPIRLGLFLKKRLMYIGKY